MLLGALAKERHQPRRAGKHQPPSKSCWSMLVCSSTPIRARMKLLTGMYFRCSVNRHGGIARLCELAYEGMGRIACVEARVQPQPLACQGTRGTSRPLCPSEGTLKRPSGPCPSLTIPLFLLAHRRSCFRVRNRTVFEMTAHKLSRPMASTKSKVN